MGLVILITGLVVFLGSHFFVTMRDARAALIARLGDGGYKSLFSLVSLAGLILIVWGYGTYRTTGGIDAWAPPRILFHVAALLMWIASLLMVATYLPGRIKARAKHPMLAGVKIWAFAHLLTNSDLGSIFLFGSFLVWAIYARIAARRRESAEGGAMAVVSGWTNDLLVLVFGTLLYLALALAFHPYFVGVPVMGR